MSYLESGSPVRYHLSPQPTGIDVAVRKEAAVTEIFYSEKELGQIGSSFGFDNKFVLPSSDREWGFGPVISQQESPNPDWIIYSLNYPHIFNQNGVTQAETSQSLDLLLRAVRYKDISLTEGVPQNLDVRLGLIRGHLNASPIDADMYPPVQAWLADNDTIKEERAVEKAMKTVFTHMWDRSAANLFRHDFLARWSGRKKLYLKVPGDACDLSPETYVHDDPEFPYRLTPHNVDSPHQQLTLLAGLAKIEEMIAGNYYRLGDKSQSGVDS